jgi:hypothetical protein
MLGCYLVFGVLAPVQGTLGPVLDKLGAVQGNLGAVQGNLGPAPDSVGTVLDNMGTVFASVKTDLPEVSLLPYHVDRASCSPPTAPRHVGCQRWLVSKVTLCETSTALSVDDLQIRLGARASVGAIVVSALASAAYTIWRIFFAKGETRAYQLPLGHSSCY